MQRCSTRSAACCCHPTRAGLHNGVQGLCVFDDANELADGEFSDPLARVTAALAKRLDLEPQHDRIAAGASLADWRATYTTVGAHDAWRVHGAWIDAAKPHFGTAIAERWQAASRVGETEAAVARAAMRDIRARVRDALGTRRDRRAAVGGQPGAVARGRRRAGPGGAHAYDGDHVHRRAGRAAAGQPAVRTPSANRWACRCSGRRAATAR